MMICTHCGANNSDETHFCQKCGNRLEAINNDNSTLPAPQPIAASPYESSPYRTYGPSESIYPPPPPDTPYWNISNPYESKPPFRSHSNRWYLVVIGVLVIMLSWAAFFELGQFIKRNPQVSTNNHSTNAAKNTSVPTTTTNSCGAFSDEFNGNLHPGWNWINQGGRATNNVTTPGLLAISTTGESDLNATTNNNAPRLLQPIMGNFTVQTLVELPSNQQAGFQAAGILIWQDESNFIRVERYLYSFDFEQEVNGVFSHNAPTSLASSTINGSQFELQVHREGDFFTASWRLPGQSWQLINTANIHLLSIMVGLDLISQGAPQTTAYYHYFKVSCT